jgi:hypothetical protein
MLTSIHFTVGRAPVALCLALGLTSVGAAAERSPAYQFSADIVSRDAAGAAVGSAARVYVANRQVRIETTGVHAEYFLIDGDAGSVLLVRPAQQVFMDAKQSSLLTQIFVPIDLIDPCRQWRAAARTAGMANAGSDAGGDWRCARIDAAIVDGRSAVEYRVVSPDRKSSQRWIDPNLEFPVKLQAADGTTITLEHIRLEAQPANLFAAPPSYRKFDPQALIERIKHSDVWADSPKPPVRGEVSPVRQRERAIAGSRAVEPDIEPMRGTD